MKPADWFNLAGLVIGSVAAVLITSVRERALRERDQRMRILGMLMANRAAPGGGDWDIGFSLVPLYYGDHPAIMTAWRDLLQNLNTTPTQENEAYHLQERARKINHLLFKMASKLKAKITEPELAAESYFSKGSGERNAAIRIIPNALVSIAETLKSQLEWIKGLKPPES